MGRQDQWEWESQCLSTPKTQHLRQGSGAPCVLSVHTKQMAPLAEIQWLNMAYDSQLAPSRGSGPAPVENACASDFFLKKTQEQTKTHEEKKAQRTRKDKGAAPRQGTRKQSKEQEYKQWNEKANKKTRKQTKFCKRKFPIHSFNSVSHHDNAYVH